MPAAHLPDESVMLLLGRHGYQDSDLESPAQAKVYGASWHMVMSMADVVPDLPEAAVRPVHPSLVLPSSQGNFRPGECCECF